MRGYFALFVFLILIATPFVFAVETEINVKTLEFYKVGIFVLDSTQEKYTLLESYHIKTDAYGIAKATYTGSQDNIKIRIQINDNNGKVVNLTDKPYYEINSVATGSPLYYQMIPGDISLNYKGETASSESASDANVVINSTNSSSVTTIGHVVNEPGFFDKFKQYVPSGNVVIIAIGIFFGVGVIIFLIVKIKPYVIGKRKDHFFTPEKSSDSGISKLNTQAMENELFSAQKKLTEAQSEINRIKNRDKIEDMERKLADDRKELDRLRRGS